MSIESNTPSDFSQKPHSDPTHQNPEGSTTMTRSLDKGKTILIPSEDTSPSPTNLTITPDLNYPVYTPTKSEEMIAPLGYPTPLYEGVAHTLIMPTRSKKALNLKWESHIVYQRRKYSKRAQHPNRSAFRSYQPAAPCQPSPPRWVQRPNTNAARTPQTPILQSHSVFYTHQQILYFSVPFGSQTRGIPSRLCKRYSEAYADHQNHGMGTSLRSSRQLQPWVDTRLLEVSISDSFDIRVRGTLVNYSPTTLNRLLGTIPPVRSIFDRLSITVNGDDLHDILCTLNIPGTDWFFHGHRRCLKVNRLNIEAKVRSKFVRRTLLPTSHDMKLSMNRVLVVYCILKGYPFDVGRLISSHIKPSCDRLNGRLSYPTIIHKLLAARHVLVLPQDVMSDDDMQLPEPPALPLPEPHTYQFFPRVDRPPERIANHPSVMQVVYPLQLQIQWLMRERIQMMEYHFIFDDIMCTALGQLDEQLMRNLPPYPTPPIIRPPYFPPTRHELTQTNHTHNMASNLKGVKKTTMTDEIRRALCKHNKDNPSVTQKQLQEWVSQATISNTVKRSLEYLSLAPERCDVKRHKPAKFPDLEKSLDEWILQYQEHVNMTAWTMDVSANTIANYFRHCKLRSTDNMTFENSDEGGESTQELQNLIKELGYRNAMDVEDVLTHPEENVVA
ncbi:hypothetical protein OSB04_028933 [Centaurea solstitialis]|uniref:Putative plant transposon protein domain-containing protein n=1 Tax=Centaurea solstitialis TaxID=347529 RepID=A0AA38T0A6_9ASTR|nr:hypothetical protein OSB04_028933 [Centaurea solstitialis]